MMDDPLRVYLAEIEPFSRTPRPERAELLEQARAGDVSAKRAVIQAYLLDAARIAMAHGPDWASAIDKIQEANLVLIRTVEERCTTSMPP